MKNRKYFIPILFAVVYAVVLSFGIECLFTCIGIMGTSVFGSHSPYMYWFSFVAGILSTASLIVIFILNLKIADKCCYNKYIWWIQSILSLVLAFFMVKPWEMLFLYIREML